MNAQDLKNSILLLAIKGKLVEQREEEETAEELYHQIQEEKQRLVDEGTIRKQKKLPDITEEEIPFDIPDTWKWVRLGDVLKVTMGQSPKGKYVSEVNEGIEFHQGKRLFGESFLLKSNQSTNKPTRVVSPNTVLLSVRAPVGAVNITKREICIGRGLSGIEVYKNTEYRYVFYMLNAIKYEFLKKATGTTFTAITANVVMNQPIPLPPLEEQNRIVAKIEELMPYVDRYDGAYEEVTELNKKFPLEMEKSILQYAIQGKLVEQKEEEGTAEELYHQIQEEKQRLIDNGEIRKQKKLPAITEEEIPFDIPETWKWVRLSELAVNIHYGYTASANESGNAKLLRITDIQNDNVKWPSVPYCNTNEKELERYKLYDRDIVIARTGGTIGKTYLIKDMKEIAVFASYLIRVIPCKNTNEEFLKMFMNSPLYWMQLREGSMGTGQPNVNATTLSQLLMPLPPLNEQKRIINKVGELLNHTKNLIKEV